MSLFNTVGGWEFSQFQERKFYLPTDVVFFSFLKSAISK